MKRLLTMVLAFGVLTSLGLIAQDTMKNDDAKAGAAPKLMTVVGKISDDGKSFTSDKDSKSWTIVNPEAVKGHEGHHVALKAHVYPDKGEVHVMSLKMAGEKKEKDTMSK